MPSLDLSRPLLSATGSYQAGGWASVAGSGALDVQLGASLKRGIDIQAGAEALVMLDAGISKFLAAGVTGEAHAAARVRAQVQVPLDLFSEAGLAIRLQAIAEAAAGVQLAIGLSIGDFLALAEADPAMHGLPMRLLRIFLEEAQVQGGFMAKAAAAAMAYANVAMVGRLVPTATQRPGFTVSAEAGVGLKAGAGFRVFATFGLDNPRRLLRRSVDAVVDETVAAIRPVLPADARPLLDELRVPAKLGLRTCFELGLALGERGGTFSASDGPVLAQRCVQVFLEESQRFVLEKLTDLAVDLLREAIEGLQLTTTMWHAVESERIALASALEQVPDDPFEPTPANRAYWSGLLSAATNLVLAAGARNQPAEPWARSLSIAWSALELLFACVERVSEASARASILGVPPAEARAAFQGPPPAAPPQVIARHINDALGRSAGASIRREDLVAFLLRDAVLDPLVARFPAVRAVVEIVAGPGAAHAPALATILGNIAAFAPGASGGRDAQESLRTVVRGLQAFVHDRLQAEIDPVIRAAINDVAPDVRLYLDDVLLASLVFTLDVVFERTIAWAAGSSTSQVALREACSSVVMRLLGRSLVVSGDVLLDRALVAIRSGLLDLADHVGDANGIADVIAGLTPGDDRALIAELIEEALLVTAEVFEPLPDDRRHRIRNLLYQVIDTAPSADGAAFLDELADDFFVPNLVAARELAFELGGLIAENVIRFVAAFLERVGSLILAILAETLAAIEREIEAWIASVETFALEIQRQIEELVAAIGRLEAQLTAAFDLALGDIQTFLGVFGAGARRSDVRRAVARGLLDRAIGLLEDVPGYSLLPSAGRDVVEDALDDAIDAALDNPLIDGVLDALAAIATETSDFLGDVRNIDPEADLATELIELLVDRVEDALRDALGSNPRLTLAFRARGTFNGPRIDTLFGSYRPTVTVDLDVDLGSVSIPVNDVVAALRSMVRTLGVVVDGAEQLAQSLAAALTIERDLDAAEANKEIADATKATTDRQLAETHITDIDIEIVRPAPASAFDGAVEVEIHLANVPRSYLGLAGEAQRVQVLLDDAPLDLTGFEVEEIERPLLQRVDPGGFQPDRVLGSSAAFGTLGGAASDPKGGPAGAIARALAFNRLGHQTAVMRGKRADQRLVASQRRQGSRVGRSTGALGAGQRLTARAGGKSGVRGGAGAPVSRLGIPGLDTATLGRRIRPTQAGAILASLGAGVILRGRIGAEELSETIHTISCAVLTGRGQRASQAVSFLKAKPVVAPDRPRPGELGPRVRLPASVTLNLTGRQREVLEKAIGPMPTRAARRPRPAPSGPQRVTVVRRGWVGRSRIAAARREVVDSWAAQVGGVRAGLDELRTTMQRGVVRRPPIAPVPPVEEDRVR